MDVLWSAANGRIPIRSFGSERSRYRKHCRLSTICICESSKGPNILCLRKLTCAVENCKLEELSTLAELHRLGNSTDGNARANMLGIAGELSKAAERA